MYSMLERAAYTQQIQLKRQGGGYIFNFLQWCDALDIEAFAESIRESKERCRV